MRRRDHWNGKHITARIRVNRFACPLHTPVGTIPREVLAENSPIRQWSELGRSVTWHSYCPCAGVVNGSQQLTLLILAYGVLCQCVFNPKA